MQTAAAAPLAHSRRHGRNACYPPPQTLVENHDCHGGARSTTIGALHDGHTAPSGTSSAMSRPGASFVSSPAAAAARWRTRQSAWKAQPHWTVYLHAFGDGREGVNCARARRARARAPRWWCAGSALLGRTLHGLAAHPRTRASRRRWPWRSPRARAALARHDRHPLREARRRVVLASGCGCRSIGSVISVPASLKLPSRTLMSSPESTKWSARPPRKKVSLPSARTRKG